MAVVFAIFLALHGAIHLLGAAKAFGLAARPQLTRPVPPLEGILWLAAALFFGAAAVAVLAWPRGWWILGAAAILLSAAAIVPSWEDAKYGAVPTAIALAGVVFGFLAYGPSSLRAEYERDVAGAAGQKADEGPLTETDLAALPAPVQRYIRAAGAVGRPKVQSLFARLSGRIRSGPAEPWMRFEAEQHNVFGRDPKRLFYMTATRALVPVQGYHRYAGASATMRIKAAAAVPLFDVSGEEMLQGETVTLFNDMCVLAPAALIDPAISWDDIDASRVRATYTNAGRTIRAELTFGPSGVLEDFQSDDRYRLAENGSFERLRWSTPLGAYRSFGDVRLAGGGEARWGGAGGEFAYIELTVEEVRYNVSR